MNAAPVGPILGSVPELLQRATLLGLFGWVLAFFVGMTSVGLASGFLLERVLPNKRIYDVPLFPGQYRFEAIGNVVFVAIASVTVTAALRSGWVRLAAGATTLRSALTFAAILVGFQVFYWFLHRAMHARRLVVVHRWHHRSQVTSPLTGQSMSAAEACLWMLGYVGLPALLSLVTPLGFWGWAGYLAFNVFGNVVGHANVEPSLSTGGARLATFFTNPFVYHSLHHARWTGHYGFQASTMDFLMGTEFADWPRAFERVRTGHPLTSLKERC